LKRPSHGVRESNDEALRILRSPEPGRASVLRALPIIALFIFLIFCITFVIWFTVIWSVIDLSDWWPINHFVYLASPPSDQEEEQHNNKEATGPDHRGRGNTQIIAFLHLRYNFSYEPKIAAVVSL